MALWDQRTFLTNRRRKLLWSKDILADLHNFIIKFWGKGLNLTDWVMLYKRMEKGMEVNISRHTDSFANVCVRVCVYECVTEWASEWMNEWVSVSEWLSVCVWGLSRWTGGLYGWNKVITETRVSKLGGLISETWHFQVALIQGYHINLTLLSEGTPGRKWVEGHDLESTSQTSPAMAHTESHKVSCAAVASTCQMAWKSESMAEGNLWRPCSIPALIYKYPGNCHRMTTRTTILLTTVKRWNKGDE